MSIVVTGATGHLGRLIVEALLAPGSRPAQLVAAAGRRPARDLADLGVRDASRVDYDDPDRDAAGLRRCARPVVLVSG